MMDYQSLLKYGNPTSKQREKIEAVIAHGSARKAAKVLGVHKSTIDHAVAALKKRSAQRGYSPEHHYTNPVPDGFRARGVSQLFKEGQNEPVLTWVKSTNSMDPTEYAEMLLDGFLEPLRGKSKPLKAPKATDADKLTVYGIGDAHCGLYAWEGEAEENFDLSIWEKDIISAMKRLTDATSPTEQAVIVNVGDFIHADNLDNKTAKSGNVLDVDGRWPKVLKTAIMAMRELIILALKKHKTLTIINAQGNHDNHSSVALTIALQMYYENDPRVKVLDNASKFHHLVFGKNLLAVTHSDTVKIPELESVMSSMWPEAWGKTEYRYWLVGHMHHRIEQEFRGCDVIMLRSLVAQDAWHWGSGYRGKREMIAITYHKDFGEEYRNTCSIKLARHDDHCR